MCGEVFEDFEFVLPCQSCPIEHARHWPIFLVHNLKGNMINNNSIVRGIMEQLRKKLHTA